jgi:hypothetical protein
MAEDKSPKRAALFWLEAVAQPGFYIDWRSGLLPFLCRHNPGVYNPFAWASTFFNSAFISFPHLKT